MGEWIEDLAATFALEPLTARETAGLLAAAREVAHRVERKGTPLAAFLLGMDVAARVADGRSRDDAIQAGIAAIEGLLPPAEGAQ